MDFQVVDRVMLKVLSKVGDVAYRLELPQQLSRVHNTFHVSNQKKCLSDESLVISLDELRIDDKLYFVEESVESMDRKIKQLKRSRIPIIKVRWNSKRGPEFTWEREDQFKQKRMIPEPGDPNREVPVNETFHVQTDDELTKNELKQIEADDYAIQTILLGLPKDVYAAVDSCELLKKSGYMFSK
nr:putative reverse transcriptase domain-containing protein [Tanacetum cinerariifolium]